MKIDTSGKVAYWCKTKEDSDAFLEECEKQGIRWCSGNRPTELARYWNIGKEKTLYELGGHLYMSSIEHISEREKNAIIEYKKENKMDIKEFVRQLDKDSLAELKAEIKKRERMTKRNVIGCGEKYYCVNMRGQVYNVKNNKDDYDRQANARGFVFRTKSDAEEWSRAMELRTAYERWCAEYPCDWKDIEQHKYYTVYNVLTNNVYFEFNEFEHKQGVVYCSDKRHIQAFIDKIGEPDYIKYIHGIGLPERCWLEV